MGPNEYSNNRDFVYHFVRDKILRLEFEPGKKVSEKEIGVMAGVSRTPVREAFIKLNEEGLLNIVPQSGTYVSKIDMEFAEESRFVRINMERAIIAICCEELATEHLTKLEENLVLQRLYADKKDYLAFFELDELFHREFYLGTGKEHTWELLKGFNSHLNRFRWLRLMVEGLEWETIINQHIRLFEAVKSGDKALADAELVNHLHLMIEEKGVLFESYPDYF